MKFLFIAKPFFIEPLGIMYLSSIMKQKGHKVDLIMENENLEERLLNFRPDIVGYSVMTGDHQFYAKLNKHLKSNYNFFSIAGGPHPTFFPEYIHQGFDAICQGEGEEAIIELLEKIQQKEDFLQTRNFWFNKNGEIIKNPIRPLIQDLDSIPFPDRSLVLKYSQVNSPIKHFMFSRGCPYNCSYCFNHAYSELYQGKGKRVRFRSVDNLLDEVEQVIGNHQTKLIYFQDDTFILDRKKIKEFKEKYPQRIGLPFHCHVRANLVDEELTSLLKEAGCTGVHIAAETADDYLRNKILNRNMTKEQIIKASNLLKSKGIKLMLQNMIGLPEGNIEKDIETLKLNIDCQPECAWVSIYQPYPKTKLGEYCREIELYTGDFSDIGSNFYEGSVLNFSNLYKNQLENLQALFGLVVNNPWLLNSGVLESMLDIKNPKIKKTFRKIYQSYRKHSDTQIYGFNP